MNVLMWGGAKFQCTGFEEGQKRFRICTDPPPVNNDSSLSPEKLLGTGIFPPKCAGFWGLESSQKNA